MLRQQAGYMAASYFLSATARKFFLRYGAGPYMVPHSVIESQGFSPNSAAWLSFCLSSPSCQRKFLLKSGLNAPIAHARQKQRLMPLAQWIRNRTILQIGRAHV